MTASRLVRVVCTAGLALLTTPDISWGQRATGTGAAALRDRVREYRAAREGEIVRELAELLAIPNVARDSINIRRNADHLVAMLRRRGVDARRLELQGSPPAVYGELRVPGARRTVMLYAHYDGQPVVPEEWASDPWKPVLRTGMLSDTAREVPLPAPNERVPGESRLYARSAGDDKSPIVAMLRAIDALEAVGTPLSVNVKFFLEGEEEAGSANLRQMLLAHRDRLRADVWLFGDGPVHQTRAMQVVFGVRGVMGLDLTVYGPSRALHSGHYGNWAPNPIAVLTSLLSSMRDADGRILIDGFYDDVTPLSDAERAAVRALPPVELELRQSLALGATEADDALLAERIALPALNLRGFAGGQVGDRAANAIPTHASASIDFRLVPRQTPERVRSLVEAHVRRQGFFITQDSADAATRRAHERVVALRWEGGYPAVRTSMELPVSRALLEVVQEASDAKVLAVPTLGGSLPLNIFLEILDAPLIVVPIVNHDNNQHAANENLRIQNLWDGIEVYAAILARLGTKW
jgi:acetylornithine deacetylase/succinyl-diaminopimelate desuccinylase-like protein